MRLMRLTISVVAALLMLPVASASGEVRSETFEVSGTDDCLSDTGYELPLPPRAIKISPSPGLDAIFRDPSTGEELAYVFDIAGRRDGSSEVTWAVTSSRCLTFGPWSAGPHTFSVSYGLLSPRPRLGAPRAKRLARKWLSRKFPFFRFSSFSRVRCRRGGPANSRACKVFFGAGDTSYRGSVRVSLFSKPNTSLFARLRYRLKHTNHYCIAVLDKPRSQCTDTIRGRARVD
jgi:hypothetical protein